MVIAVIGGRKAVAHLHEPGSGVRIEVAELVVGFLNDRGQSPSAGRSSR